MKEIKFVKKLHGNMKLVKILNNENHEEFKKYCLRYGVIISDGSYEATEGYYKGYNRHYEVFVDGLLCKIDMNNGNARGCGYETCDNYDMDRIIKKHVELGLL